MALHPSPPHSPLLSWCWLAVCVREVRGALLRCVSYLYYINSGHRDGGLPGFVPKEGRRIWSNRATWVLLHAAQILVRSPEVGELEIALSFALLRMSWDR